MSKFSKVIVALLLVVSTAVAGFELYKTITSYTEAYPNNDINGYVAWAAGGPTDTMSRALSVYAAEALGTNIVVQNKTGASGSVATEFVKRQKDDGYSILFNAENPPLYKVMNISQIDYDDYYPVLIIEQQTAVMVVAADSKYNSIEDVVEDAKANPGKINLATTGAGGLTSNVAAMMEATSGVTFNQVPFDGDSAVLTAVLGGHSDLTVINYSTAVDYVRKGTLKIISVFDNDRLDTVPDVAAISEVYPDYEQYFPWGPFVGVFVDNDCSDEIKETLTKGFYEGWQNEEFQKYLTDNYVQPLGYSGDEAREYIEKFQQVTTWLLYDSGATDISPEEYGISRIGEED